MMNKWWIVIGFIVSLLTGCTEQKAEQSAQDTVMPIDVQIEIDQEAIVPGEEIAFRAVVTQGEERVEDADEVVFEFGKGDKKIEDINGTHIGEGVYEVKRTFSEAGEYYVVAHVTAREMHNMPKKVFTVGDKHSHSHHSHNQDVLIHFMSVEPKVGQEVSLTVHVHQNDAPVEEAEVQFEIKKQGENADFVDAKENVAGEYIASYTWKDTGTYDVIVHVKKEDIHEHHEATVEVK